MFRRGAIVLVLSAICAVGFSIPAQAYPPGGRVQYRNTGPCHCLEQSTDFGKTWVRYLAK